MAHQFEYEPRRAYPTTPSGAPASTAETVLQAKQELAEVAAVATRTHLTIPEGLEPEAPSTKHRRWSPLRPPRLRNRSSVAAAAEMTRYIGPWLVVVAAGCWLYNLVLLLQ